MAISCNLYLNETQSKGKLCEHKHYNFLCRGMKRKCQQDKEHYLTSICIQVESAHAQKKSREVYDADRKITGKQASRVRVVKNKKGVALTDQEKVRQMA